MELDLESTAHALRALPDWLPDESLFSLCSRYHVLSGAYYDRTTCDVLFGHHQRGTQHDFPSRIDHLVEVTRGSLGSALDIIRGHTLLPYYLPLKSGAMRDDALAAMRGDGIGSLKYRLGLLTSGFGANHPLRACPECMASDLSSHGVAYWHVGHQYPGTWVCLQHQCLLLESDLKSNGIGRFLWLLPGNSSWRPEFAAHIRPSLLLGLARICAEFAHLSDDFHFDPRQLAHTYRLQLVERTGNGLRGFSNSASEAVVSFCQSFRGLVELQAMPRDRSAATSQLSRLLSPTRTLSHPLAHAVYILFLFGSWPSFMDAYTSTGTAIESHDGHEEEAPSTTSQEVRDRVITALKSERASATAIAAENGIDVLTVMTWASAAGIATKRRPKLLKEPTLEVITAGLQKGDDRSDIARAAGVSESSVIRVLRLSPELRATWAQVRKERLRDSARSRWMSVLQDNPHLGAKAARILEPATYMWLYRNDRAWLSESLTSTAKNPHIAAVRVDWDSRDIELAHQVQLAAMELASTTPGTSNITLKRLFQHLPTLRTKASKLDRLPLTRRAIESAIGRSPNADQELS